MPVDRRVRVIWLATGLAALSLLLTVDDRYAGAIADGRQMSWTAVAIAETGEIGQARGRDFTWPRADGDSVSRYGMGMSLAQLPAASLAPRVEERFGPGSSQPLFLIVPILCVCLSAAAAGWIALSLDLRSAGIAAAVLLTAIGSPLGSYAALDLSEPLQSAALTVALASALAATHGDLGKKRALLYAGLAGFGTGVAVLTKSSLWLVAPFALLPMLNPADPGMVPRRLAAALAGLAVPASAWVWFELARFGQLFASYAGEGFTHPFFDGAWRLLVGANRGLVLYFPAVVLALASVPACWRGASTRTRMVLVASLGLFMTLLAVASTWWAWHGLWGWGPRLLVPAIPALAACAALVLDRCARAVVISVILVSVLLNLPGLLQNAAPVTMFTSSCEWPQADATFAMSLAGYARRTGQDGAFHVAPDQVLEKVPQASPFLVYPWFARVTARARVSDIARALEDPPWVHARPDITCDSDQAQATDFISRLKRRGGWPLWGRGFFPDSAAPGFPGVYDEGLLDQVIRAEQLGRAEQAHELAGKLGRVAPGPEADVHIMESLRRLGRRAEAAEYLSTLPPERRSEPRINVVLALFERDRGSEQLARNLLASVSASLAGSAAERAVSAPLSSWPRDLNGMLAPQTDNTRAGVADEPRPR